MNYPVYFTRGPGARDDLVSVVTGARDAVDALETFTRDYDIGDCSMDSDGRGRLMLCLDRCRGFYYTYLDRVADRHIVQAAAAGREP